MPKKKTLTWKTLTHLIDVASFNDTTFVLTRNLAAGKPNRYNLAVCEGSREPVIVGRELTPGHCRRIAEGLFDWLLTGTENEHSLSLRKARAQLFNSWMLITKLAKKAPSMSITLAEIGILGEMNNYLRIQHAPHTLPAGLYLEGVTL